MEKIYQPIVKEKANNIVDALEKSDFFKDFEITNREIVYNHFCEKLTTKFINGDIDEPVYCTENDLIQIITETCLIELKEKGMVNSIEDENGDERFFLTEMGKKVNLVQRSR
jgi:Fe2+ or Zn2+ uptake regulation protein